MIACLQGELFHKSTDRVIIMAGGVGYEVFVSLNCLAELPATGRETFLHIATIVREDAFLLFGFADSREKEMFHLLIGVNGVGPKLAMSILSAITPGQLVRAVAAKDLKRLTKLPGVGKKTAERLCLDLKDKVGFSPEEVEGLSAASDEEPVAAENPLFTDVVSGLVNLGYPPARAQEALRAVRRQLSAEELHSIRVEDLLRKTLRSLA